MARLRSSAQVPALTIAGTTVILFTIARIPTEIFYGELGVQPEDVGLNSVQVLLQGSAVVLAICVIAGLAYAALIVLFSAFYLGALMKASGSKGSAGSFLRIGLRLSPIFVVVITLFFALFFMIQQANEQSAAVRAGRRIEAVFLPWRAEPVQMTSASSRNLAGTGCGDLFYLGESDGIAVLYSAAKQSSYRIPSGQIELRFPELC